MPRKLNDLEKQQIRRAWALGDISPEKLAEQYGVSVPTIRRAYKGVVKGSAREIRQQAAEAIADAAGKARDTLNNEDVSKVASDISGEDFFALLKEVSHTALTKGKDLPFNSGGEAISAGIRGLQALRSLYPMTMREAAEWVVNLPGFNAKEFAKLLREVWDEKRSA